MFIRDKTIDKKFMLISVSLENINQEIYKLQKAQKDNSLKNVEDIISSELNMILENLLQSIRESQSINKREIDILYNKILKLENNIKQIALPNIAMQKEPKERIRELYDIGYSIEDIAKEVGIPAGEVKLILKLQE
jgi:hypothetical protein